MACDIDDRFLFKGAISFHHGALETLPSDRVFDAIILSHVLEHILNPGIFVNLLRSRLKPGGYLFLLLPHTTETSDGHWWIGWSLPQLAVMMVNFGFDCREGIFEIAGYSACGYGKKMDKPVNSTFQLYSSTMQYLPDTFSQLRSSEQRENAEAFSFKPDAKYIDKDTIR